VQRSHGQQQRRKIMSATHEAMTLSVVRCFSLLGSDAQATG
jgi:hypothetical protein